eukprot:9183025-Lingulodinium_polyedra.AAC.1
MARAWSWRGLAAACARRCAGSRSSGSTSARRTRRRGASGWDRLPQPLPGRAHGRAGGGGRGG